MSDKSKNLPPLPRPKRPKRADDAEDETLIDVKVDLPAGDEWDEAEPTIVGESLQLPPVGDAGADDETMTGRALELPPADEWDDAEPTIVGEPLERPDEADTAPRDALYAGMHEEDLDETAPRRIRESALPPRADQPRSQPPRPQQQQQQAPPNTTSDNAEPARPPVDFRDALPLYIVSGTLCLVVTLLIAVRQWLAPWAPVAAALGAAATFGAAITYLYCERDWQQALAKGLGICAAFALPTLVWIFAPVRVSIIENFGQSLPLVAQEKALHDSSGEVQLAACAQAALGKDAYMEVQLVELFATEPALGAACVDRVAEGAPDRARSLSHRFLRRWNIAFERQENALVCGAAPHLLSLSPSQAQRPAQRLTYCATTSTDPATAKCCADAITERFEEPQTYVISLGETSSVPLQQRAVLFEAMVTHAFAGVDASRIGLPELERRLMRKTPVQDWILGLGCQTLFDGEGTSGVMDGLDAMVESQECRSGNGLERKRQNWLRICADQLDGQRSSEELCESVHRDTVDAAVQSATAEVHAALDALFADETSPGILRAHARFNRMNKGAGNQGRFMAEGLAPAFGQAGDARTRHMARSISGNYKRSIRELQETAASVEGKDEANYDESVQNLLQRRVLKPTATWNEVKQKMSPQESEDLQRHLDKSKKKLAR